MRRLLLVTLLMGVLTAGAQGLVTPMTKAAKQQAAISAKKAGTRGDAEYFGRFFVNCKENTNARQVAEELRALGAKIRGVVGDIVLMEAPYSKLEAMAAVEGVLKIDLGPRIRRQTDITRNVTQAGDVINGTGEKLPQAYTGKGVMVGVIDAGFDLTHPMLKDKDGNLRVKGYYVTGRKNMGDLVIIGPDTLAGSAFSKAEDMLDTLKVKELGGSHGTHCVTIAAGSTMNDVKGIGEQPIGGMAPEADILICSLQEDKEFRQYCKDKNLDGVAIEFYQALYYMLYEATNAKKPLVASISYNSMDGWHDGTSNMARILKLCAETARIPIMLCASNSGSDDGTCYLNMKSQANDTLNVYAGNGNGGYVWGGMKTTKNVKFEISIASGKDGHVYYKAPLTYNSDPKVGTVGQGTYFYIGENADNSHLKGEELKAANEMLKYIEKGDQVQLWCYQNIGLDQDGKQYTYTELNMQMNGLEFKKLPYDGETGRGEDQLVFKVSMIPTEDIELHAWGDNGCEYFLYGQKNSEPWVAGNSSLSVGDWNTSGETVSIGAWCANNKHKGHSGKYTIADDVVGDYAFFSSYGTDLAGHHHPDVCTPGHYVVAAGNSFDTTVPDRYIVEQKEYSNQFKGQETPRSYPYLCMSGTSMSTPAAAGIVALWLQAAADKGKTLSNDDIKEIIRNTSDTDKFTEGAPQRFGSGKMNAYKGLLYVLDIDTSIPTLSKEQPKNVSFRLSGDIVYADGAEDGIDATVYNLQGVAVRQTKVQDGAINLAGLQQGVYAIQLGKLGSTLIRK